MKKILGILFIGVISISLMMVPAASVGANPAPGIVGLWHFDNNADDSSGNNLDGVEHGEAGYVSGMFDMALSLDGDGDYVQVDDDDLLDITGDLTIEAWVNFDSFTSPHSFVVGKDTTGQRSYGLWVDGGYYSDKSGKVGFIVFKSGVEYSIHWGNTTLVTGQWYHIAGTYDYVADGSSVMKIYVDGSLDSTAKTNAVGPIYSGSADLQIGARQYPPDYWRSFVDGAIDEVRIWDVALKAFPRVLKIDAIHELEEIKDLPCLGKCKGVSLLTLKYTGAEAASIEAISKGKTCFDGDVAAGGTFDIFAVDDKLGANTKMYVDGALNTEIHTSCSRPLRVGMRFGDFEVEDVDSLNEIDNAIKHIQKSLDSELWEDARHLDAKHGKKVFDEEKKAVKHLMKIAKGKVVFKDNFKDPAFTSTAWKPIAGVWAVEDGEYSGQSDGAEAWTYVDKEFSGDLKVEFRIKFLTTPSDAVGKHGGIMSFATTQASRWSTSGYTIDWIDRATDRGYRIHRWDGGHYTLLGILPGDVVEGEWYDWKVVIAHSKIELFVDGESLGCVTDPTTPHTTGYIGLWLFSNGQHAHFDKVSVLCRCKPEVVAEVHKVIKKLVVADEALARTAIHEAETTPVIDEKNQDKYDREIAKAHEELAKAEEELMNKRPDKAIDHKKKAWEHAQHAIKEALKPPKPAKPAKP